MKKTILLLITVFAISFSNAQNETKEFANYSVGVSVSPFGGSLGFGYNLSPKTTFQASIGGFKGSAPISPEYGNDEYDVENSSSWVGMFVNHRPFEDSDWFRVGTGFGVGKIQNELTNTNNASDVYHANYEGNIVAYVGVGVGSRPVKGLQFGLDVGVLSTGGATVFADRDNLAPKNAILNEIEDDSFFGSLLPNVQLNISWGF